MSHVVAGEPEQMNLAAKRPIAGKAERKGREEKDDRPVTLGCGRGRTHARTHEEAQVHVGFCALCAVAQVPPLHVG